MSRFLVSALFPLLLLAGFIICTPALNAQVSFDWTMPGDKIEETEGRGLNIRSNPSGAKVFIDGIERGSTPLRLTELRAGNYFVRLEKEGFSARRFRVSIRSGSVVDISLELKEAVGRIILRIQPDLEPRIIVDGKSYSHPALELPVGFRTIQVRAFGWEDISTTVYIEEDSFSELEINMKPAAFKVLNYASSRSRFNPANSGSLGTTGLSFEVSAPGKGSLTIKDEAWNTVFSRSLGPFETWSQTSVWDGRDNRGEILSDGTYTLIVEVESLPLDDSVPVSDGFVIQAYIDSARLIRPLTLSSGKSGLLYAPLPVLLPTGSFQIEGSLLAGYPPILPVSADDDSSRAPDGPWRSLPFAVAFRVSPLDYLEVSAALNVIPYFEGDTGAGIAANVKWAYLSSIDRNLPLRAAAGLVFSWTGKTAFTPFGMASGIELYFPFQVDLGTLFSFALTPAALWTGDEGFPWEPVPRLLVSGGLLLQMTYFSAGLSLRSEYKFQGGAPWPPYLTIGAEVKIFPPPSSFVFSIMGGVWIRDNEPAGSAGLGGFGGIGIGMIY